MAVATKVSVEDYLELEQMSEVRHEYENGELREMPGGSENHSLIGQNIRFALKLSLPGQSCKSYDSALRVKITTGVYTYPDASVVYGEALFENAKRDSLLNPTVVFEVLSPSTESYDRGKKFGHYQTVLSISDYLIVSQDVCRVEHFIRQAEGWLLKTYDSLESKIFIASLNCGLALADIYDDIKLE
jgi:Uma2 family endonuclease